MLSEIRVRDLGVIDDLSLVLDESMTAVTGETGAGKTLVVEAVELLVGGRADASMVRAGAPLAVVEGRFEEAGREMVLRRELPTDGRSRAYVDGRMASAAELQAVGAGLVDLHGQHSHQSLLHREAQRRALDHFAGIDTAGLEGLERDLEAIDSRLGSLGGKPAELARELELLSFQVGEIEAAGLSDPDEEEALSRQEAVLSSLDELRRATGRARALLDGTPAGEARAAPFGSEGASGLLGEAARLLGAYESLADLAARAAALESEAVDISSELRSREDTYEDDPERLAEIGLRKSLLSELKRKYGGSLAEVGRTLSAARARLSELDASGTLRHELETERADLLQKLAAAEARLLRARSKAAPSFSSRINEHLRDLAMEKARISIAVGGRRGDEVSFMLAANPGEPALALSKVASGGELSRAMLALRLVLSEAPPTLVFDEVDAGIGGAAAVATGRALQGLARRHQVLVVTHLAQVAAFADAQIAIAKQEVAGRAVARATAVVGEGRLVELSRMLSGMPGSASARRHAAELLALAGKTC